MRVAGVARQPVERRDNEHVEVAGLGRGQHGGELRPALRASTRHAGVNVGAGPALAPPLGVLAQRPLLLPEGEAVLGLLLG